MIDDKTKFSPAPVASCREAPDTAARARRGRPFAKGTSGNPAGRPPGARNKATLLAQSLLAERGGQLIERILTLRTTQTLAKLSDLHPRRCDEAQSRRELNALVKLRNSRRSAGRPCTDRMDATFHVTAKSGERHDN